MNKYQKELHKRTKLIQRNSSHRYSICKKLARIRAIYDFFRMINSLNNVSKAGGSKDVSKRIN